MSLTANDYQEAAGRTAVHPMDELRALSYLSLKLNGEAGEVAELVGKWIRGDGPLSREKMLKELGDVQWYLARLAKMMDLTLEEVMQANLEKLARRQREGTLQGSGSDR